MPSDKPYWVRSLCLSIQFSLVRWCCRCFKSPCGTLRWVFEGDLPASCMLHGIHLSHIYGVVYPYQIALILENGTAWSSLACYFFFSSIQIKFFVCSCTFDQTSLLVHAQPKWNRRILNQITSRWSVPVHRMYYMSRKNCSRQKDGFSCGQRIIIVRSCCFPLVSTVRVCVCVL